MEDNRGYTEPQINEIKGLMVEAGKEALKQHLAIYGVAVVSDPAKQLSKNKKYVHGISGLARIIGCSNPTAQKIKDSGIITFVKVGRKFLFEEDLVLSQLKENTNLISKS